MRETESAHRPTRRDAYWHQTHAVGLIPCVLMLYEIIRLYMILWTQLKAQKMSSFWSYNQGRENCRVFFIYFLFLIITISVKSALSVRKERPEKSMWNLSVWSHAILWWSKSTASHLCFRDKKEMHECIFFVSLALITFFFFFFKQPGLLDYHTKPWKCVWFDWMSRAHCPYWYFRNA